VITALALAGCEAPGPASNGQGSAPLELPQGPDVRPYVGLTLADFIATPDMAQFALEAQGLSAADQARFMAAHAQPSPAVWMAGGGAEALVFYGCAAAGCGAGASVMAVDHATGETFLGVRDGAGAVVVVPNLRLEALLRLGSASGAWDDPNQRQAAPAP
jgi:hypothetical protein